MSNCFNVSDKTLLNSNISDMGTNILTRTTKHDSTSPYYTVSNTWLVMKQR